MLVENCWKKASEVSVTWIEPMDLQVRSASYNCSATANVDRYQGCIFAFDQEGRMKKKNDEVHFLESTRPLGTVRRQLQMWRRFPN